MTPWELPAGNFFLEEINRGCDDGCHMVIVLPAPLLIEAVGAVDEHFYRQRMMARQIELTPGLTALATICEKMMLESRQDWKMLLRTDLDTQFVLLSGFEALPESEQAEISRELMQVARFSHSGEACWHFLLFVLPGDDSYFKTDLRLRIISWWNRLGPVDIEYAFQKVVSSQAIENYVDFLWCYSLFHALRDPSLAFSIVDTLPRAFEEVQAMLEEHSLFEEAQKYSESISNYQQNNAKFYIYDKKGGAPVDKKAVPMWRHGFVCENGSLHPVAIHAAKRTKDLKKCIAKGQIRVLLPIIQDVHAGLLAYLNKTLPDGWLNQIEKDEDIREGIRTEIGPLAFCIKRLCYDKKIVRKHVCDLAFAWRKIRNSLAHYEPIQYDELNDALVLGKSIFQE